MLNGGCTGLDSLYREHIGCSQIISAYILGKNKVQENGSLTLDNFFPYIGLDFSYKILSVSLLNLLVMF